MTHDETHTHAPESDTQAAHRPLTAREREILGFLLSVHVPGIEELRGQADFAVARHRAAGDASIYLGVDRERASRSVLAPSHLEIAAWSRRAKEPGDPYFELSLWANEGWLETIEIIPYTDTAWPEVFPPPGDFEPPEVTRLDRGEATEA